MNLELQKRDIPGGRINVWPALDRYCTHIEGTDVFYSIKHAKVLGEVFRPGRVLNQMLSMRDVPFEDRPQIFQDMTLNRQTEYNDKCSQIDGWRIPSSQKCKEDGGHKGVT